MKTIKLNLSELDGQPKYEFYEENNILKCKRYGEEWRAFVGDHAVNGLFDKAIAQQEMIEKLDKEIERLTSLLGEPE